MAARRSSLGNRLFEGVAWGSRAVLFAGLTPQSAGSGHAASPVSFSEAFSPEAALAVFEGMDTKASSGVVSSKQTANETWKEHAVNMMHICYMGTA